MLDRDFFDIEAEYLYCERWGKEEDEESEDQPPERAKENHDRPRPNGQR